MLDISDFQSGENINNMTMSRPAVLRLCCGVFNYRPNHRGGNLIWFQTTPRNCPIHHGDSGHTVGPPPPRPPHSETRMRGCGERGGAWPDRVVGCGYLVTISQFLPPSQHRGSSGGMFTSWHKKRLAEKQYDRTDLKHPLASIGKMIKRIDFLSFF